MPRPAICRAASGRTARPRSRCRGTACRPSTRTSSCSAPRPGKSRWGRPGDTRAFDARTGAKLWEFHTVPRPGEKGHETWLDDGWKGRSGVNDWGWYQTLDEQRGILYMALGGPGGQLLGRRSSRRQPVRELDRRRRRGDRKVQVALPDRASRPVGFRQPSPPVHGGHPAERTDGSGARAGREDRLDVHPRSHHRQADLRRRGAARAEGRRAGRVVFADAAVSGEAAAAGARGLQQGARHGAAPKTRRRSTSRTARRCGTRAAGSTTRDRSRRSCFTRTARRRRARSSFRAAPAA